MGIDNITVSSLISAWPVTYTSCNLETTDEIDYCDMVNLTLKTLATCLSETPDSTMPSARPRSSIDIHGIFWSIALFKISSNLFFLWGKRLKTVFTGVNDSNIKANVSKMTIVKTMKSIGPRDRVSEIQEKRIHAFVYIHRMSSSKFELFE